MKLGSFFIPCSLSSSHFISAVQQVRSAPPRVRPASRRHLFMCHNTIFFIFQQKDGALTTSRSSNSRSAMGTTGSRALRRLTHQQQLLFLFSLQHRTRSIIYLSLKSKRLGPLQRSLRSIRSCDLCVWLNVTGRNACNATMDLTPRQEATSIDQQRLVHPWKNRSK